MKRTAIALCILAQLLMSASGCSITANAGIGTEETETAEEISEEPVRPQDDFYRYINGSRLQNAVFEQGETTAADTFSEVQDNVVTDLKSILADIKNGGTYEDGTEEYLIQRAYEQYMEYRDVQEAPQELNNIMEEILSCTSVEDVLRIDARLYRDYGVDSVLNLGIGTNYLVSGQNAVFFDPYKDILGCSMKDLQTSFRPLSDLRDSVEVVLQSYGVDHESAEAMATDLGYFIMDMSNSTDMEINSITLPFAYYNLISEEELSDILSNIDIDLYLEMLGADNPYHTYIILDEGQLRQLNLLFTEENLGALRAWKAYQFFTSYSMFMVKGNDGLADHAANEDADIEDAAFDRIHDMFSSEFSILYAERYYSEETDQQVRAMCDDIKDQYRELISGAAWLTEETREDLLLKLDNMICLTGMNIVRHDASEYTEIIGNDFYETYRNLMSKKTQDRIASLPEPVDRTITSMPMQMVNACYIPSNNSITITAAIVNAPFFDPDAGYFTNLGGLGMVIAHEMGHAFDSTCILFDSNGAFDPERIPDPDMEELARRNEAMASYFEDNFTIFGVYHVNGHQTMGENYADLGAMECITSIAGTREDLIDLFSNYANTMCCKTLDSGILESLQYDEHSPDIIRVNAILSTLQSFYEAYDVNEGDGMYIEPALRVSRWY
ncbi:MAG: M13 family metallopeptidase [Clostridiales bacterium]|nr:M13 family metallopeptidase [Clostridiales bacterium]